MKPAAFTLVCALLSLNQQSCKSTSQTHHRPAVSSLFQTETNIHLQSTSQLNAIVLQSGGLFQGFHWYTLNAETGELSGRWNRAAPLSEEVLQAEGKKLLSREELKSIELLLRKLKIVDVTSELSCHSLSDGPQDKIELTMLDSTDEKHAYTLVPSASYTAVCGDVYVEDNAFQRLDYHMSELLPRPDDEELYKPIPAP